MLVLTNPCFFVEPVHHRMLHASVCKTVYQCPVIVEILHLGIFYTDLQKGQYYYLYLVVNRIKKSGLS